MADAILQVKSLYKWFPVTKDRPWGEQKYVKAVNGVSFQVQKGEIIGVVGESGCGKSTLGKTLIKLQEPTKGEIRFDGIDITKLSPEKMRPIRKKFQIMFQDPYSSLDPRMIVGDLIGEPMDAHRMYKSKNERRKKIEEIMEECGLNKEYYERYPHEFSGGQRQRIGIARALSVEPELIICDEPVSALDVSIQSQIINLLIELQKKRNLSLIFISHDLSVVHYIADRVMVMYLGQVVEMAGKQELFDRPLHPYTKALIDAIPIVGENKKEAFLWEGDLPSPVNLPTGCPFHSRCSQASEQCNCEAPKLQEIEPGHFVSCLLFNPEE